MKKILLTILFAAGAVLSLNAQTIFSNGTGGGDWSSGSTWLGGVVPTANADVVIAGTDSVSTTTNAICTNLTVLSGGKLSTGIDSVSVSGTFMLEADAWFYNRSTKGTVPGTVRELDPASTVVHSGSGTVGNADNNTFGNLIIVRVEGCVPGANLTIKGNLVINNGSATVVFRGVRPTTGSQTHTVEGNLIIERGTISCIDVGDNSMVGIWNIKGDVIINSPDARFSCFSSANASGLAIYNIDGNIINNGGRIQAGTSSSAGPGIGIINLKGNFTFNSGIFATNSLGAYAINFKKNGVQNFYLRGVNVNLNTNLHDTIFAGSTVVMDLDTNKWGSSTGGEFVVDGTLEMKSVSRLTGSGNFTLNENATLKIGNTDGITLSTMLGSVQMTGTRTFSNNANYIYNGTVAQTFGDGLPASVKNLEVANATGVTLLNDLSVTNSLKITNGSLDLGGKTIFLTGSAMLTESPGKTVKGTSGKITVTANLNAPSSVNPGGLGAVISSSANLGATLVERYHSAAVGNGNSGILRRYNVQPANNSGLSATMRFNYDESELNGQTEAGLVIFRSANGSDNTWSTIPSFVNTTDNYVEVPNVGESAFWTIGGAGSPLPVEDNNEELPVSFRILQNYPNPFNPATTISFEMPEAGFVNVSVYNTLGEKVAELVNNSHEAGRHSVSFDGSKLSSGIYIYKLTGFGTVLSRKMNLLK